MITAKEAKELTILTQNDLWAEMEEVEKAIRAACERIRFEVTISPPANLRPLILEKLHDNGFQTSLQTSVEPERSFSIIERSFSTEITSQDIKISWK